MIAYYYGTGVYTFGVQKQLRQEWREMRPTQQAVSGPRETTSAVERPLVVGAGIFGRLRIPKLDIDVIVLEGTDRSTLTRGPGHIIDTSWPREGNNTAISGHRTTFGAPFASLHELEEGDRIHLTTRYGSYTYVMRGSAVVRPTDVYVIGQEYKNRLTLTTCDPPGSAARRLAVWAQLKS